MPLPTLDAANWARVLVVVAHPDDAEYGLSAAVHTWTTAGTEVAYLLLTSGEAGMQRPPSEVGPLRALEQRSACDAVGVADLTILHHPDGMLHPSLELRMQVARHVRRVRPDVVVTSNFDFEAFGGLNQSDHRVAGLVAVDGTRDAANRWVFPELADEGLEPWHARGILVANAGDPTHGFPVSDESVDAAVRSLAAHRAYLADLPSTYPPPDVLVPEILRSGGELLGLEHAVVFKVWDLGGLFPQDR